eukprot:1142088-Pelagomonas_calceolata.AAC.1
MILGHTSAFDRFDQGGFQVEQAEQPNYLAEGQTLLYLTHGESSKFSCVQAGSEDTFHFLQKQTNETRHFISWIFLCGWNS